MTQWLVIMRQKNTKELGNKFFLYPYYLKLRATELMFLDNSYYPLLELKSNVLDITLQVVFKIFVFLTLFLAKHTSHKCDPRKFNKHNQIFHSSHKLKNIKVLWSFF